MDEIVDDRTQSQFDAAVRVVKNLPKNGTFKPSHDMLLRFYAFYKQATLGKCQAAKPGFWDVVGKAKWDAWNILGAMSAQEAMQGYVTELQQIIDSMPRTDEISGLAKELDNFIDLVTASSGDSMSSIHSDDSVEPAINGRNTDLDTPEKPLTNGPITELGTPEKPLANGRITEADTSGTRLSNGHAISHAQVNYSITEQGVKDTALENGVDVSQTRNEINGLDLISEHDNVSHTSQIAEMSRVAPDLISTDHQQHSETAPADSSISPRGAERVSDSDTDSEVYLDSSDTVPNQPPALNETEVDEKTVDLLASCSNTSPRSETDLPRLPPHGLSQTHSSHSSQSRAEPNDTRPKVANYKHHKHTVTFSLPEVSSPPSAERAEEINEKLRMALLNMQQEISSLEKRLNLVEQITVRQRKKQLEQSQHPLMKWWPLPGVQPRTALVIFFWPVFVAWFMRYLASRRRRP